MSIHVVANHQHPQYYDSYQDKKEDEASHPIPKWTADYPTKILYMRETHDTSVMVLMRTVHLCHFLNHCHQRIDKILIGSLSCCEGPTMTRHDYDEGGSIMSMFPRQELQRHFLQKSFDFATQFYLRKELDGHHLMKEVEMCQHWKRDHAAPYPHLIVFEIHGSESIRMHLLFY
jgi:hypothetical protein